MSKSDQGRAESIRQRLRNLLRERGEDVQFALQRYAIERFLYRLGISRHRDRFVLKGATLFALWGGAVYRPTRDLDFTGYGSSDETDVLNALRDICRHSGQTDELAFDPDSLVAEQIRDDSEYQGLRIRFEARLGESHIPVQVDIGFGNAIEPPPQEAEYPTFLNDPPPRIRTYPPEAVVAEKLQAMVVLGERNSRRKDFYDLYVLARQFPFPGERLVRAVAATFARRRTPIDATIPVALTPRFYADDDRAARWRAYLMRNALPGAPADFAAVGEQILAFLGPLWSTLAEHAVFASQWQPGGPWALMKTEPRLSARVQAPASPGVRACRPVGAVASAMSPRATPTIRSGLGRFRPHPEYKDSGVEWLGEIPSGWTVTVLKRIGDLQAGAGFPDNEQGHQSEEIPFFKVGDMGTTGNEREMVDCPNTVSEATARKLRAFVFPTRTIVFAKVGAALLLNRRRLLSQRSCIDNNMMGFMPTGCDLIWALHWLSGLDLGRLANPGAVPSVNEGQMRATPVMVPSPAEQHAIATFLDHATAKIDTLVAKNERLIGLLREKRTTLITQAVTRGLDPNVPMKDSGVEWLGEIPAHWEVTSLRHYLRVKSGDMIPASEFCDEGYQVFGGNGFRGFTDRWNTEADTIIIGRYGALCGNVRLADSRIWATEHALRVIPLASFHTVFFAYLIEALDLNRLAARTAQPGLNSDMVRDNTVGIPLLAEQKAIAVFLNRETARIDALVKRINDSIELLREYRTALISTAVTGKIDVRGEVA